MYILQKKFIRTEPKSENHSDLIELYNFDHYGIISALKRKRKEKTKKTSRDSAIASLCSELSSLAPGLPVSNSKQPRCIYWQLLLKVTHQQQA